ncbi:MAG: prephenate dehydrogenase [Tepidanaerobacteraceae bacterium]|nr:prephenate dehydrogenase [Tepidanaerobacteraceae bacterium]
MNIKKIAVVGLGVIGGSLAKAFRAAGIEVTGIDEDDEAILKAKKDGVISPDSFNIKEEDPVHFEPLRRADVVFFCIPVMSIVPTVKKLAPFFKEGAVITDTGSTKKFLVNSLKLKLPEGVEFIGGHPMAGCEKSGYEFSRKDLFLNAPYILTPTLENSEKGLEILKSLILKIGAVPHLMTAEEHDRMVAAVSHLPQVVATSLAAAVAEFDMDGRCLKLSGRGFKDTTRIASSSFSMWRDVFLTNKEDILKMIWLYQRKLKELAKAIESEDEGYMRKIFFKAAKYVREG